MLHGRDADRDNKRVSWEEFLEFAGSFGLLNFFRAIRRECGGFAQLCT